MRAEPWDGSRLSSLLPQAWPTTSQAARPASLGCSQTRLFPEPRHFLSIPSSGGVQFH